MRKEIKLEYTVEEVFDLYEEYYSPSKLEFTGKLKKIYRSSFDHQVIRFISEGRKYKKYSLQREGCKVIGWIEYYSYDHSKRLNCLHQHRPPKLNKNDAYKIEELIKNGHSINSIAKKYNVSRMTIYNIRNNRGAYK